MKLTQIPDQVLLHTKMFNDGLGSNLGVFVQIQWGLNPNTLNINP